MLSRRTTGTGICLDISQRELTSFLLGEKFLSDGRAPDREGNADLCVAHQAIARTADGTWIAMTRTTGAQSGVAPDDALASLSADRALDYLREQGFAASAVLDGQSILRAPWFSNSSAFSRTPDGQLMKGFPFQFRDTAMAVSGPTAKLGQDTAAILGELLGFGSDDIAKLEKDGVIGNAPSR